MTVEVRAQLEQPAPEVNAARVAVLVETIQRHSVRKLLAVEQCAECGATVAPGTEALYAHAAQQALIALPEAVGVDAPNDAELLDQALSMLNPDVPGDLESEDYRAHMLAWKADLTRVHEKVYGPLIDALLVEIRTLGLSWETLSAHLGDTVSEHREERFALTVARDRALVLLRERNRAYGRSSTTIHELRAELAWKRDQLFDEQNKRGRAVVDLVATRMQVDRQADTIRRLLNQVRELGGTVDDTDVLGVADAVTAEAGR